MSSNNSYVFKEKKPVKPQLGCIKEIKNSAKDNNPYKIEELIDCTSNNGHETLGDIDTNVFHYNDLQNVCITNELHSSNESVKERLNKAKRNSKKIVIEEEKKVIEFKEQPNKLTIIQDVTKIQTFKMYCIKYIKRKGSR